MHNLLLSALIFLGFLRNHWQGFCLSVMKCCWLYVHGIICDAQIIKIWRLHGLAVAYWTTNHYHSCSNLGVGIWRLFLLWLRFITFGSCSAQCTTVAVKHQSSSSSNLNLQLKVIDWCFQLEVSYKLSINKYGSRWNLYFSVRILQIINKKIFYRFCLCPFKRMTILY